MSVDRMPDLLQECLQAYDSGLSPEECLSAFPAARHRLEPLLRQALSLRIAYAGVPSEEFRLRARERLLFVAGREALQAFAGEPDPDFVANTRQKLVTAAGAAAQEALRAVPPPRLPFWVNARRRFLESASARPRPAFQPLALVIRAGLSAAVFVLAIAIAGAAYLTTQSNPSVGAELASLEAQLSQVEQKSAAGEPVSPTVLVELTRKTNDLAEKLNDDPSGPEAEKLPAIIERQKDVVSQAATDGVGPSDLQAAQHELNEAEEKVRLMAARAADQPTSLSQPATDPTEAGPTKTPTPDATATPTPKPIQLEKDQVEIRVRPDDNAAGTSWVNIWTTKIRFAVPGYWKVSGVSSNRNGVATLDTGVLGFEGPNVNVMVDMETGEINVIVGNKSFVLRSAGPDGQTLGTEDLVANAGIATLELRHLVETMEILHHPTPTATKTPPADAD